MTSREIDVWTHLAAPLAPEDIRWRIDSKPKDFNGKWLARFVCYVEAGTVRQRLDSVVPGDWNLTLAALPSYVAHEGSETIMAFKATLQIHGMTREDIGQGSDYKQASTDAFKRVAVRFGIGHELYNFDQNWVEVDSDSKYAKPLEDPQAAYDRKHGSGTPTRQQTATPQDREAREILPPARAATTTHTSITTAPFGKYKGKPLADIPDDDLKSSIDWCRSRGKTNVANAYQAELERRHGANMFGEATDPPPRRAESDDRDEIPF